jgi:hypothetical protein
LYESVRQRDCQEREETSQHEDRRTSPHPLKQAQTLFTNQIMIAMMTMVPTIPYPNI